MPTKSTTTKPKSSVRKARVTTTEHSMATLPTSTPSSSETSQKAMSIKKPYLITALGVLLIGALAFYFKGIFVAALVNGQPISRLSVVQNLEKQSGKQVLEEAVLYSLINQEAKKQKVSVSKDEIGKEAKKIEENFKTSGSTLDQFLVSRGMTKNIFEERLKYELLVQKMVKDEAKVTDKDINAYIEKNKASFPEGSITSELKKNIAEQIKQEKDQEKKQSFVESLRKNARIDYWVSF